MSFLAWLAIAIVFLILEIASFSLLYACFMLGAMLAGVSTFFTGSVTLQAEIFVLFSIALIPVSRALMKKMSGKTAEARKA